GELQDALLLFALHFDDRVDRAGIAGKQGQYAVSHGLDDAPAVGFTHRCDPLCDFPNNLCRLGIAQRFKNTCTPNQVSEYNS
ncbi:hypothetical protein, partial [Rhodoferax sp.]|uniref:hypothetical protein n=1 Tax=Rhodoferax sp. TaxID=50421 RepID=UPI0039B83EE2